MIYMLVRTSMRNACFTVATRKPSARNFDRKSEEFFVGHLSDELRLVGRRIPDVNIFSGCSGPVDFPFDDDLASKLFIFLSLLLLTEIS
jgi:hypothetical protein